MSATASAIGLLYISSVFLNEVGTIPKEPLHHILVQEACSPELQSQRILEEAGQGVIIGLVEVLDLVVLFSGVQQHLERLGSRRAGKVPPAPETPRHGQGDLE